MTPTGACLPRPSIGRKLDLLLAVAVLPPGTTAAALLLEADGVARTASALPRTPGTLVVALLLAGGWALALWLVRRLTASVVRDEIMLMKQLSERSRQFLEQAAAHSAARHLQELQYQASHDELTGLANRRSFDTALRQRLAAHAIDDAGLTLLYIDIDGFKRVNDEHGHAVGDQLLRLFAARLKAHLRETDLVARLGGDEFAVILAQASPAERLQIADGLIEHLSRPYGLGGRRLEVSASIGLAACGRRTGTSGAALLAAADAAMYQAKRAGKCRYVTSDLTPP